MNDPDEAGEESTQVYMNQLQNMLNLKKSLELLQDKILTLHLAGNQKLERMEKLSPGEELFELFANAGLTQKDFTDRVQGTVRVAVDAIMTATGGGSGQGGYIDQLVQILTNIYGREYSTDDLKAFRMYVWESTKIPTGAKSRSFDDTRKHEPGVRTLCFWCFTSAMAIRDLRNVGARNILVTSGTLSPIDSMARSLGSGFDVQLANSHAIDAAKQVFGAVACCGPLGNSLNSSYSRRSDQAYLEDLGEVMVNASMVIPDGILLAFHSYAQMSVVLNAWRKSGVLKKNLNEIFGARFL